MNEARWNELRDAGVINPNVPNPYEHERRRAFMHAEFTPAERAQIRVVLGLTGEDQDE